MSDLAVRERAIQAAKKVLTLSEGVKKKIPNWVDAADAIDSSPLPVHVSSLLEKVL